MGREFRCVPGIQEMYLICPEGDEVQDGHTDQQPLHLVGLDAVEFQCFLKAMTKG